MTLLRSFKNLDRIGASSEHRHTARIGPIRLRPTPPIGRPEDVVRPESNRYGGLKHNDRRYSTSLRHRDAFSLVLMNDKAPRWAQDVEHDNPPASLCPHPDLIRPSSQEHRVSLELLIS